MLDENDNTISKVIHGPGTDNPLALILPDGDTFYYHTDRLGSIIKITDSSGDPIGKIVYDSFGQITEEVPETGHEEKFTKFLNTPPNYRFTGREYDEETGFYYFRKRYYDPSIGRFISYDPVPVYSKFGQDNFGDGTQDSDEYIYCVNDPANYSDPYAEVRVRSPWIPEAIAPSDTLPEYKDPKYDPWPTWFDLPRDQSDINKGLKERFNPEHDSFKDNLIDALTDPLTYLPPWGG